ncbi:hypothetical protein Btru_064476 [Bulinus truncatus]|nr:hypothetical protein Btru_064476 [Bulinus truncatus]
MRFIARCVCNVVKKNNVRVYYYAFLPAKVGRKMRMRLIARCVCNVVKKNNVRVYYYAFLPAKVGRKMRMRLIARILQGEFTMNSDEILENKDPAFIGAIFSNVLEILQLYGWFILIALGAVYFLYSRIQPWMYKVSQKIKDDQYKKLDEGTIHTRMEAMERARLKMQESLNEQARLFAEQQKIKEEKKRQDKIVDWERHQQGKGYRSKTKAMAKHLSTNNKYNNSK